MNKQSEFIKNERISAGFSYEQMSMQLGVPIDTICEWENGDRALEGIYLIPLSRLFGITVEEILLCERNPPLQARQLRQGQKPISREFAEKFDVKNLISVFIYGALILSLFGNLFRIEIFGKEAIAVNGFGFLFSNQYALFAQIENLGLIDAALLNEVKLALMIPAALYQLLFALSLWGLLINLFAFFKRNNANIANIILNTVALLVGIVFLVLEANFRKALFGDGGREVFEFLGGKYGSGAFIILIAASLGIIYHCYSAYAFREQKVERSKGNLRAFVYGAVALLLTITISLCSLLNASFDFKELFLIIYFVIFIIAYLFAFNAIAQGLTNAKRSHYSIHNILGILTGFACFFVNTLLFIRFNFEVFVEGTLGETHFILAVLMFFWIISFQPVFIAAHRKLRDKAKTITLIFIISLMGLFFVSYILAYKKEKGTVNTNQA